MALFPVHNLVEIPCFPSKKHFVYFTNGNEMFLQSQQGLAAFVEVNSCLEGAKLHTLLGPFAAAAAAEPPAPTGSPCALPLFVCSPMAVPLGLCL